MLVNARTVGFVVGPETVIDVSINVCKGTFAMCPVFAPFTIVLGTIRPDLDTPAVTETTLPLASIDCASLKCVRLPILTWLVGVIESLGNGFASLFLREILAAP